MKKIFMVAMAGILFSTVAQTQTPETDQKIKEEISKLAFITGEWTGEGWMMGQDGTKNSFTQTENLQFKIDSTALMIEGLGKTNGKVIHNALALVTYDKTANNFNFISFLSSGRNGSFKAELLEEKFYWYPSENIRYIIYINPKGQWYETGEMKRPDGWFQFFEMTLNKKK